MKSFWRHLFAELRYIFIFKKPAINHLDCIDVVMDQKLLLLLAWKIKHTRKVSLRPGRFNYFSSETAVIIQLPVATDKVILRLTNYWRSYRIELELRHITMDVSTWTWLSSNNLVFDLFITSGNEIALQPLEPNILIPLPNFPRFEMFPYSFDLHTTQLNDYAT